MATPIKIIHIIWATVKFCVKYILVLIGLLVTIIISSMFYTNTLNKNRNITYINSIYTEPSKASFAHAIITGNLPLVQKLIDEGADINAKGQFNITPLYLAIEYDHPEVFKLLLQNHANADVQIVDPKRKLRRHFLDSHIIFVATNDLNPEYLVALLEAGVDPNHVVGDKHSPFCEFLGTPPGVTRQMVTLFKCPYPSCAELAKINEIKLNAFLKAGADIKYRFPNGDTVLSLCFLENWSSIGSNNQLSCVRILLEHKTPICPMFLMRYALYFIDSSFLERRGKEAYQDFEELNAVFFSVYPEMRQEFDQFCHIRTKLRNRQLSIEQRLDLRKQSDELAKKITEHYNRIIEQQLPDN